MIPKWQDWWPDWTGETVLIAASGPSQRQEDIELARGKARVVVVNRTWELAPWADVLYGCDRASFWDMYRPDFPGMKVSGERVDGCNCARAQDWLPAGSQFNNSGVQALMLANQWNAGGPIVLTGFDMAGGHWHADHPNKNPKPHHMATEWPRGFTRLGLRNVVNASRETTLTCFPRVTLEDVFGPAGIAAAGRTGRVHRAP